MLSCQDCGSTFEPDDDIVGNITYFTFENKYDDLDLYDLADPDSFDAD
jgi:hypothetical protein